MTEDQSPGEIGHPSSAEDAASAGGDDGGVGGRDHRQRSLDPRERLVANELRARLFPMLHADLPQQALGRYRLLRDLGAGGMGVVFEALDPELDRRVALKVLRDRADAQAQARLVREAQVLAALAHPNIVQVYDVGLDRRSEAAPTLYLVMEMVEGVTLSQWLESAPPWRRALEICLRAGEGLASAHASGVLHRDFKPSNVLLGDDGVPRVADFGLARADGEASGTPPPGRLSAADLGLTHPGATLGTPGYMPPEQFDGRGVDERADQYAFCATVWECLTGRRPFAAATVREVRFLQDRAPPLPSPGEVPRRIFVALRRGLAPDPSERWPSMRALLGELTDAARPRAWLRVGGVLVGALAVTGLLLPRGANDPAPSRECAASIGASGDLEGCIDPGTALALSDRARVLLDAAAEQQRAGRYREALERLEQAVSADDSWSPIERASIDGARGALLRRLGRDDDADAALQAAFFGAAELEARASAAGAALELVALHLAPGSSGAAERWLEHARAQLADIDDPLLAATLAYRQGQIDAAREPGEPGIAGLQAATEALAGLGAEAEPDHAAALGSLGQALVDRGEYPRAHAVLDEALERWAALGEGRAHPGAASAYSALVKLAAMEGRYDDALALGDRALQAWASHDERHPQVAWAHVNLGNLYVAKKDFDRARAEHEHALEIAVAIHGTDHVDVAKMHENLGSVATTRGRHEEALAHFQRARTIFETLEGADHLHVGHVLANIGRALTRLGRHERAIEAYRRSLEILDRDGVEPLVRAGVVSLLAEALDEAGAADEARATARRAVELYRRSGTPGASGVARMEAWIAERAVP